MALDPQDMVNSLEELLIVMLQNMAAHDRDFESPDFVKGFPVFDENIPLLKPLIAVYCEENDYYDVSFDNIIDVANRYPNEANYSFWRGAELRATVYIDVYTSGGTSLTPSPSGGAVVAKRVAGKIGSRLILTPECLGPELDLIRSPKVSGPHVPIDSNRPDLVYYRVELRLEATVAQEFIP